MSDIAIIGAGGFVGARLVESLVLDAKPVRAVVRSHRNLAAICQFGSAIEIRQADAEDISVLADSLRGAHTVINAVTGPPAGIVRSTRSVWHACQQAGVDRLIHLSSAVVFGDVPMPVTDDDPLVARHWMPYARAKAASEEWLKNRMNSSLKVIVLRPGIVWGVRSHHTLSLAQSLVAKNAYLVDGGSGIFNGIYIDNLVACLRACHENARGSPGFYNVGDQETTSWRQFFDALGSPLGCDISRLPIVSREKFKWSTKARIDALQSLGPVNDLYHRLKKHIPDGLKAQIRSRLEGPYSYDRCQTDYSTNPTVERELWHLQRTGHKLPIHKFAVTFGFTTPVTFAAGIRKTLSWLETIGLDLLCVPNASFDFYHTRTP